MRYAVAACVSVLALAVAALFLGCPRPLTPDEQAVREVLPATADVIEWGPHGRDGDIPEVRVRFRLDGGEEHDRVYRIENEGRTLRWRDR